MVRFSVMYRGKPVTAFVGMRLGTKRLFYLFADSLLGFRGFFSFYPVGFIT